MPLTDLGTRTYRDTQGGLYPGGANVRPPAHEALGARLATTVAPLNPAGKPDPEGRYVLLSIGMSNASFEFRALETLTTPDPDRDAHLVVVDGAQGSADASKWANPTNAAWGEVDNRLATAGVTRGQVAVAWVKLAEAEPTGAWPDSALELEANLERVARNLRVRYPNLRLAYFSSRTYGGYATTKLSPEPYAYESGFSVKLRVQKQLDRDPELNPDPLLGPVVAPWIAWGPYLWADGLRPRGDGLTWACTDFAEDGTNPAVPGRQKVAALLLNFFKTDSTARQWYLATPGPAPPSTPPTTSTAPVTTKAPPTTSTTSPASAPATTAGTTTEPVGDGASQDTSRRPGRPKPRRVLWIVGAFAAGGMYLVLGAAWRARRID
ncbi:MAG TPA: hypothetical protein VHM89_05565 [Acidimicrobiales bacterium]|nr:hypothetical protein [Acidimicrobiales bacterium]